MVDQIRETRLDNGTVVLTDRMPGVRSATLGFFFRKGARNEPASMAGITHFIEHAVFKGYAKRTALQIAIEQDRLGGSLDAFTTHEETGFAIKVIDDKLRDAFDLLADMIVSPTFDESELESEKRVIIEEIKMTEDSPEDRLGEIFIKSFFNGHPLGRPIAGDAGSVRALTAADLHAYHSRAFACGELVIAAAGSVDHDEIVRLTEKYLAAGRPDCDGPAADPETAPAPHAGMTIERDSSLEQAHIVIATPFVSARDDRRYAADLLTSVLGGGMSSRLWQKIREERGLAYNVGAADSMYQDCGVFSVFAGTSPESASELLEITVEELGRAVQDGITEEELDLAKQQARTSVLLSLEDSAARAAALAQSELVFGRQISVEETIERLEAVTRDDAAAIARECFRPDQLTIAALGDLGELQFDAAGLLK